MTLTRDLYEAFPRTDLDGWDAIVPHDQRPEPLVEGIDQGVAAP
jgi:hypothetical protein